MSNETPAVKIDLTPEYKRNLRELSKKYRHLRLDTQAVIEQLQQGDFIGDRISGLGENYIVLKVRETRFLEETGFLPQYTIYLKCQ